jgi:allantoin racemase
VTRVAVILGEYPDDERKRRAELIRSYGTADMDVDIVSVAADPYSTDLTGGDVARATPAFIDAAVRAERAGFDAIAPWGTLDIGVDAARTYLDIPIVGPFEAGLRLATMLGDRVGLITYTESAAPYQATLARMYGLDGCIVGSTPVGISLNRLSQRRDELLDAFVQAANMLRGKGAQVIIPAGVTMCPVLWSADVLSEDIGLPVVDCVGASVRLAGLLAASRLKVSRDKYPAPRGHSIG